MISVVEFWLACAGIAGLLVVLAWAGSRRRRVRVKELTAGESLVNHCGNCGYDLTGLAGDVCPECGSDLTLVGRVAPSFRRWQAVPVTARTVIWTVAVTAMAFALAMLGKDFAVPRVQALSVECHWQAITQAFSPTLTRQMRPVDSHFYATLSYTAVRKVPPGQAGSHGDFITTNTQTWEAAMLDVGAYKSTGFAKSVRGWLQPGPQGRAGIDPASNRFVDKNGVPIPRPPADLHGLVVYLLTSVGYDGSLGPVDEAAQVLADDIQTVLDAGDVAATNSPWTSARASATVASPPKQRGEVVAGYILAWLAVWAVGLPFIVRKRSVRIRAAPTTAV